MIRYLNSAGLQRTFPSPSRVAVHSSFRYVSEVSSDDDLLLGCLASLEEVSKCLEAPPDDDVIMIDDDKDDDTASSYRQIYITNGDYRLKLREEGQRVRKSTRPSFQSEVAVPLLKLNDSYKVIQGAFYNGIYVSNRLGRDIQLLSGEHMRIHHVLCSVRDDRILLCGELYRDTSEEPVARMLPQAEYGTELYQAQIMSSKDESRPLMLFTAKLEQLQRYCHIVRTNMTAQQHHPAQAERSKAFGGSCWPVLFCRYKFITPQDAAPDRDRAGALVHISETEADYHGRVSDEARRYEWRGQTTRGGSAKGMLEIEAQAIKKEWDLNKSARERFPTDLLVDQEQYDIYAAEDILIPQEALSGLSVQHAISILDDTDDDELPSSGQASPFELSPGDYLFNDDDLFEIIDSLPTTRRPPPADHTWKRTSRQCRNSRLLYPTLQRYSCGDGFCGGGGTGRGMREAGCHVDWSFDVQREMCDAFSKMSPSTLVANTDVFGFITNEDYHRVIDILHLSPPCQFFSPAHTRVGQRDEENTAAQFHITDMLHKVTPRVATLEQTAGLIRAHSDWFWAVVEQFTSLGFSVRWKIVNMADYGVPQQRMRLIIIASCPGEPLPDFPAPRHSKQPSADGKRAYHTVNDAIRGIPASWHNHDPVTNRSTSTSLKQFDGNKELAKTLTCGGGVGNIHPNGRRGYTMRELACLQTFPLHHTFPRSTNGVLKKQIGNAVPPLFAKRLFSSIVEQLKIVDGV